MRRAFAQRRVEQPPRLGCSEKRANVLTDLLGDLVGRARAVEGDDALRMRRLRAARNASSTRRMNSSPSRSMRSRYSPPRRRASSGSSEHEERAVGQQPPRDREVQLAARAPRRARARSPGRRPTSRGSGRRRRPRRARAPAGSRARRARRARRRRAPPRPRASCRRRAARGRAPPRRPACRPARASASTRRPCSRSHSASSSAWVLLPDQSTPSKVTNIWPPNLRPRCGRSSPGAQGFIGSNLVDALVARGDEVTVVDNFATGKRENLNPDATLLEHDIREPFALEADVDLPPRRAGRRADVDEATRVRRGRQRRRDGQRPRERAGARR